MTTGTIGGLPSVGGLAGDELFEVVQKGSSRKVALLEVATFGESARNLSAWAYASAFRWVTVTRDTNGAPITANIVWPDGVVGVFTTDHASTEFLGAIDAWHATYQGDPVKTVTQPLITRDANGGVTAQPAITIQSGEV